MISESTHWRTIGDIPYAVWDERLRLTGARAETRGLAAWNAAQPHSAVMLALMMQENQGDQDPDLRTWTPRNDYRITNNLYSIRIPSYEYEEDSRGYIHFPDVVSGIVQGKRRLLEQSAWEAEGHTTRNPYLDAVTVRDLIEVMSPPGPGGSWNDTETLIRNFVRRVNEYGVTPSISRGLEEPMALQIRQSYIPAGNRNRPGTKLTNAPLWITVHETANTGIGTDAEMHRQFTHNGGGTENVSFHFAVDDSEAVQLLPLDEIGWHAGDGCDSRPLDLGCYQSVAIETCVNVDGNWAKTLDNLEMLMAAIIQGDSRIGFAGRAGQFSPERIAQHNRWSGKNCPAKIRALGIWGQEIEQTKARLTTTPPVTPPAPPPEPDILPGLDLGVVRRLFGTVTGEDGKTYQFDPDGPVSRLWLARAKAEGVWPKLQEVWSYDSGERRYFRFADGSLVLSAKSQAPRWLRAA